MLFDHTCFLVHSDWDFRILSCMLKTVLIKFLQSGFVYVFKIPKVLLEETLMFFLRNVSLLLGLCFDSEEMHFGST